MKRIILSMMCLVSMGMAAQRIDINNFGRQEAEGLEPGYTAWTFGRVTDATAKFATNGGDSITIRLSAVSGLDDGNGVRTNYWKQGVVNLGYKLIADGCNVITIEGSNDRNVTEGSCGLQLEITGLPAGNHTLLAYHNCVDGYSEEIPSIDVAVNGTTVATGIKQTIRAESPALSGQSYIHFSSTEGETVTIQYISKPEEGKSYPFTSPVINALVFDEANPVATAFDPYPINYDYHVDADNGSCQLRWSGASSAVKHHLYLGTDAQNLSKVAELTDTTYTVSDLYNLNTYYWRIDEEDANGNVFTGEQWVFRPRHLAFPGAEGYGRYATGGRGGVVYHVTNLLNDENPGSLRYGLVKMTGPRTIVFDVSGVIDMDFGALFTTPSVTIAAQTAPGKGICLMHSNLNIGSESICRFLRARRGYGDTGNAMGTTGADHTIIDHTTACWGTDETFSSRGAKNITFQYSMIAEALGIADHKNYASGKNHGFAATIGGDIGTFSHNLLVHCSGRNWSMGGGLDGDGKAAGELDMFNNVCYNWHSRTTDGGAKWMHFVNNYYKMGPDTDNSVLFTAQNELGGHRAQFAYVSGNVRVNKNGSITQDKKGITYNAQGDYPEETWVDEPFFPSYATIHTAEDAYKIVTSDAGATMPRRDDQHLRVVRETVEGSYTYVGSRSGIKGEIDHEDDCGSWEIFPEEQRDASFDTDGDGMPNWWEALTGSNPDVADNNEDPDHDGYTLLEDYLNFMAIPHVAVTPDSQGTLDLSTHFAGYTADPVFTITSTSNMADLSIEDGHTLVIKAKADGISIVTVKVTDSEGSSYERQIGIAVSETGLSDINQAEIENLPLRSYELYTTDGKMLLSAHAHGATARQLDFSSLPTGIYILKAVHQDRKQSTSKVVIR